MTLLVILAIYNENPFDLSNFSHYSLIGIKSKGGELWFIQTFPCNFKRMNNHYFWLNLKEFNDLVQLTTIYWDKVHPNYLHSQTEFFKGKMIYLHFPKFSYLSLSGRGCNCSFNYESIFLPCACSILYSTGIYQNFWFSSSFESKDQSIHAFELIIRHITIYISFNYVSDRIDAFLRK